MGPKLHIIKSKRSFGVKIKQWEFAPQDLIAAITVVLCLKLSKYCPFYNLSEAWKH